MKFSGGLYQSFYNIIAELDYLCIEIGHTVLYAILVTNRLFVMRKRMKQIMTHYDSSTYNTIALMVIAAFYSVFGIAFIAAFAMHAYGLTTLMFPVYRQDTGEQTNLGMRPFLTLVVLIGLGHCPIIHHHSCRTGAGSYKRVVD
jgi:hypothetical protein